MQLYKANHPEKHLPQRLLTFFDNLHSSPLALQMIDRAVSLSRYRSYVWIFAPKASDYSKKLFVSDRLKTFSSIQLCYNTYHEIPFQYVI